jgi:hypothetical protein
MRNLLRAFLGKALPSFRMDGEFPGDKFRTFVELAKHKCPMKALPEDATCMHMKALVDSLWDEVGAPQYRWVSILLQTWSSACLSCDATVDLVTHLICGTSQMLDESIGDGRFAVDPLRLGDRRTNKRRRVDESFKESVINATLQQKRARSGAAALRAMSSDVHPQTAHKWEATFMSAYQVATFRANETSSVYAVLEDGCRLGEPAEETQLYLGWNAECDVGIVHPPIAPRLIQNNMLPYVCSYCNCVGCS